MDQGLDLVDYGEDDLTTSPTIFCTREELLDISQATRAFKKDERGLDVVVETNTTITGGEKNEVPLHHVSPISKVVDR